MSAPKPTGRQAPSDVEVAYLDLDATIVGVNEAWVRFAQSNGGDPARTGVGMSYVEVCDSAGDPVSDIVAAAIRAASQTVLLTPVTVRIPCHGPGVSRFFDVGVASRVASSGRCIGTTVTVSLVDAQDSGDKGSVADDAGRPADESLDLPAAPQHTSWLETSTAMTQEMFAGHAENPIDLVLHHAAQAARADFAASIIPLEGHRASVQAVAADGAGLTASYVHLPSTFAATVIDSGRPSLLAGHRAERDDLALFDTVRHSRRGGPRSLACVPWISPEGRVWGALMVGRRGAPFAQEDLRHLEVFAADAETAMSFAAASSIEAPWRW